MSDYFKGLPRPSGYNSGEHGRHSGSQRESKSQFRAVCSHAGMSRDQRQDFHIWLHSNHGIDGHTTGMSFNELLELAIEFMR